MFVGIKSYIFRFSKRSEVASGLSEQKIKDDWQKIIKAFNKQAVDKSDVIGVKSGTLIVRVINSLWLQEMFFYKSELDKTLLKYDKNITSIKFVL